MRRYNAIQARPGVLDKCHVRKRDVRVLRDGSGGGIGVDARGVALFGVLREEEELCAEIACGRGVGRAFGVRDEAALAADQRGFLHIRETNAADHR